MRASSNWKWDTDGSGKDLIFLKFNVTYTFNIYIERHTLVFDTSEYLYKNKVLFLLKLSAF